MNYSQLVQFDVLRSLAFGGISASYAPVVSAAAPTGASLYPIRAICITNNTNGDMLFTNDGVNDKLFIPKNSFKLFDLTTNKEGSDSIFALPVGTIISVKQSSAATSGSVYVEFIYGLGD